MGVLGYSSWLYLAIYAAYALTVLSCIVVVLGERRNPIKSLAWVVALLFLPVVGVVLYLFFGRSMRSVRLISRRGKRRLLSRLPHPDTARIMQRLSNDDRRIAFLTRQLTGHHLTEASEVEIFTSGHEKFDALIADITSAQSTICLQYYIFSDDRLGRRMADLLIAKAKQGVEVRVLYDHVGSFSVRRRFFTRMNRAGVLAHPFFRVTFPQLANRINFRNHRKCVVIDQKVAYIGGMNIADRYIEGESPSRPWRDTHIRVTGPVVTSLLYQFSVDWNFLSGDSRLLPLPDPGKALGPQCIPAQLVTSGPTDSWPAIALVYQKAILSAQKSVYIQTPYFLPTDALLKSLQTAALSGVDVRVMMPLLTDSRLLRLASFSYVGECLEAGVKIYLYTPGMLHAKTMTIDDSFVSVGSTNFDFRSFEHNFEGNLLFYDKKLNERMRNIFFDDLGRCQKATLAQWKRRPMLRRLGENVVRLLSPIL